MASGEGRHGQSDRPWSADAGDGGDTPDLWPDEPAPWSQTPGFYPGTATHPAQRPTPPAAYDWSPGAGWVRTPTGGWAQQHAADVEWPSGDVHAANGQDQPREAIARVGRHHSSETAPHHGGRPGADRGGDDLARTPQRRAAVGARPEQPTGRHAVRIPEPAAPSAADQSYGRIVGLTAAWYSVPAVLCVIWLIVLDSDRRGTANRELLTNLPWIFGALVVSMGIAVLLRWASIAWRAWTLSFAAAVIGAGLATVLHSFSF